MKGPFRYFLYAAFASVVWSIRPIVIVPGIGGSQIEAKLDRDEVPHFWCDKKYKDWFTIWLSIEELLPWAQQCWVDNMKMVYNETSGRMENTPGVESRSPGFGNTSSIEWLDPYVHGPGIYFFPFVDSLVKLLGYERGVTLRAAPYDFRLDPSMAPEYFVRLKQLIEETHDNNGNQAVMLVSHSMGAPYTVHFLRTVNQAWKDKYIKAWTTISGCFGGSVKAVQAYVSGDGFGIPSILDKPRVLRHFQRTFPSLAFILPDQRFWNKSEELVVTDKRSYNVFQYDELFKDIGYPVASKVLKTVPKMWYPEPPNVRMFCFHGTLKPTPGNLKYPKGYFPDYDPVPNNVDGDGTVTHRSLRLCEEWVGKQKQEITYQTFTNAEHNGILGDARFLRAFNKALKSIGEH